MAKINLTSFVKKLQRRMGSAPMRLSRTVEIGDYGEAILLESVTEEELDGIDESLSDAEQDKLMLYMGSPTLRAAAAELLRLESIAEPIEIMKQFKRADVAKMAGIVAELTSQSLQPTVAEVEEIKNS